MQYIRLSIPSMMIVLALILFGVSCSTSKYIPEGEYLLDKVSIQSNVEGVSQVDLSAHLRQKPNYKTFGLYKLPLHLYSLSGKDSSRFYNRWLKTIGEPPVIYDETLMEQTAQELQRVFINKGFVHAQVEAFPRFGGGTVDIDYVVQPNLPFVISNYIVDIQDSVISNRLLSDGTRPLLGRNSVQEDITEEILLQHTLIQPGMRFDLDVLDAERGRVVDIFRRQGYYTFSKEYVGFIADTLNTQPNSVSLEMVFYPMQVRQDRREIAEPHRRYRIASVDVYLQYDPLVNRDIVNYQAVDSFRVEGCNVWLGDWGRYIRTSVLMENIHLRPNMEYNSYMVEMTYNSLSRLDIFRNVNIQLVPYEEGDEMLLKAIITCLPEKKQGFIYEIEGTNTTGMLGIASAFSYKHRNIFKGSEELAIKLQGSFDAVSSSSTEGNTYYEIGTEGSLTFPRLLAPFLSRDFKRRSKATTQISMGYSYQQFPKFYKRSILSVGVKYLWQDQSNGYSKQSLDLLNVSYVHFPYLSSSFYNSLSEYSKVYSFRDQFIAGVGYSYSHSNFNPLKRSVQPVHTFRASVETAGNLLNLTSILLNKERDELGMRKVFGTYFAQYAKGNVDYSRVRYIDDKNSVAWRIGAGVAVPYGNSQTIPIQKRFFAGGANSVRGWNVRELGPGGYGDSSASFFFHSGDIRFDANMEYRSKVFWRLELAAFLDVGNVWTIRNYEGQSGGVFRMDTFYRQLASAWGLGFRFDFDFVLARLDFGWKLYDPTASSGTNKWRVLRPLDLSRNMAWHIAVGYPF